MKYVLVKAAIPFSKEPDVILAYYDDIEVAKKAARNIADEVPNEFFIFEKVASFARNWKGQ